MTSDILANEISDYVVYEPAKLIAALNKAEIKVDEKDTDEAIIDEILKALPSNKKLSKALAFIIAEGNELVNNKENSSDKSKELKLIADISDGISKVGTDITANTESFKDSIMSQIVSKAGETKEYKRIIWNKDKKSVNGKVWLIAGGIAVGLLIYWIYRKQKDSISNQIPAMVLGGEIPPVATNIPAPMPVQTALAEQHNIIPIEPIVAPITATPSPAPAAPLPLIETIT